MKLPKTSVGNEPKLQAGNFQLQTKTVSLGKWCATGGLGRIFLPDSIASLHSDKGQTTEQFVIWCKAPASFQECSYEEVLSLQRTPQHLVHQKSSKQPATELKGKRGKNQDTQII